MPGFCDTMRRVSSHTRRSVLLLSVGLVPWVAGCKDDAPAASTEAGADGGVALGASASASSSASPSAAASSSAAPESEPALRMLSFSFTTGVNGKEPIDVLEAAEPGQRVWGHLRVRNRSSRARKVTFAFRVNDEPRTVLDLDVSPSWSYRTWGYNTLRKGDKAGKITLRITDDAGTVLVEKSLPIKSRAVTKPKAQ